MVVHKHQINENIEKGGYGSGRKKTGLNSVVGHLPTTREVALKLDDLGFERTPIGFRKGDQWVKINTSPNETPYFSVHNKADKVVGTIDFTQGLDSTVVELLNFLT